MRTVLLIPMLALCGGVVLAAPPDDAPGQPAPPVLRVDPALDPRILLHGVVRDEDLALLFAHVRASLLAAAEGRQPPPTDELNRRMEAIGGELRARGMFAGLLMLSAFESAARQALREALAAPPPVSY